MKYKLREVAQICYGKNQKEVQCAHSEIPILGTGGFMGYSSEPLYSKPSVLIGRKGSISKVRYIEQPFWTVDTLFYTKINEDIVYPRYLYYVLSLIDFSIYDEGTSIPSLRTETLNNVEIEVPSLDVQKKSLAILETIDKKIETNAKINDNLQQQALALFSYLYSKADTKVKFTGIGQILSGGTPKTSERTYWDGGIPFFTPKDIVYPYTIDTEKKITNAGLQHCNSQLYPKNTVFVTARGTVGKVSLAGVPMAMNQSCYAIAGINTPQLLVYFYTLKTVDALKRRAVGSVFDAITYKDFESITISRLDDKDAQRFINIVEPYYQAILNNSIENQRLATLRDYLLPLLMSGKISIGG